MGELEAVVDGRRTSGTQQHQQREQHPEDDNEHTAKKNSPYVHDPRRTARVASRGDTRDPCWPIAALAGFSKDG